MGSVDSWFVAGSNPNLVEVKGRRRMAEKLNTGDMFPSMTVNLVDGGTLDLPGGIESKYKVLLFYRGHW